MVTGNDIAPARRSDYAKISSYRKGDMLQLMFRDAASAPPVAPLVADSRCLGTLADNRSGVVIKPGVLRGGIMRNIVVAANVPSKSEPVMSLYSANEVMPFTRASHLYVYSGCGWWLEKGSGYFSGPGWGTRKGAGCYSGGVSTRKNRE